MQHSVGSRDGNLSKAEISINPRTSKHIEVHRESRRQSAHLHSKNQGTSKNARESLDAKEVPSMRESAWPEHPKESSPWWKKHQCKSSHRLHSQACLFTPSTQEWCWTACEPPPPSLGRHFQHSSWSWQRTSTKTCLQQSNQWKPSGENIDNLHSSSANEGTKQHQGHKSTWTNGKSLSNSNSCVVSSTKSISSLRFCGSFLPSQQYHQHCHWLDHLSNIIVMFDLDSESVNSSRAALWSLWCLSISCTCRPSCIAYITANRLEWNKKSMEACRERARTGSPCTCWSWWSGRRHRARWSWRHCRYFLSSLL